METPGTPLSDNAGDSLSVNLSTDRWTGRDKNHENGRKKKRNNKLVLQKINCYK